MGARNRNAAFQAHQLGEHFSAAYDRDTLGARRHQFRIVAFDRGRYHQHVGAGDVLAPVPDADGYAFFAQTIDIGAFRGVRALHRVAEIAEHLGDAAHADAADPDEVDGSDLAGQSHFGSGLLVLVYPELGRASTSCFAAGYERRGWPG